MESIVEKVRKELSASSDAGRRESGKRFFKEEVQMYGVSSAEVTKIARKFFPILKERPKEDIFSLCEELWQSGYLEEGGVACLWSHSVKEGYQPEDFAIFSHWVETYINNWASCDTLCNHSIGDFVMKYPEYVKHLYSWTKSENRWKKRGAAVSLIIPARRGFFLEDVFAISDSLLPDTDDMVQKGYGWMLKAASEAHPREVFEYVLGKKSSMPRTAYRYALEKLPREWRAEAMKK